MVLLKKASLRLPIISLFCLHCRTLTNRVKVSPIDLSKSLDRKKKVKTPSRIYIPRP